MSEAYDELKLLPAVDDESYNYVRDCIIGAQDDARIEDLLDKITREELTMLTFNMSLCPLHLVDYAICFDDENSECEAIRKIWPGHDT